MLKALDSHGWSQAFRVGKYPSTPSGDASFQEPFSREDVSRIIALKEGNKKKYEGWVCLCRLRDRRYAFVYATPADGDLHWIKDGFGWSYTDSSFLALITLYMSDDCTKRVSGDLREFAHRKFVEKDTKREIVELVLGGVI